MGFVLTAAVVAATALAPGGGVALSGDSVVFSSRSGVLAAPVSGGPASPVLGVRATSLSADSGVVAAVSGSRLFVGGRRVLPDLGETSPFPVVPQVQATAAGVLTLEDGDAFLRAGGRRSRVAVPPGADPSMVAAAGGLGVAVVPEGALVVFELASGIEQREISLGSLDPVNLSGL